ncbi:MAG: hypothetical protein JW967_06315 [Dehalococcoidales bacterium]|nr:hypothetical protein [Dehalococcoidales bacterium]
MVVKKVVTAKKPAAKKAPVKKTGLKGQVLECSVCGLVVTVNKPCTCGPECEITCCGKPLKTKKTAVRAKTATK